MFIYIPTRGRLKTQSTWDNLPEQWRDSATLVISAEEAEAHRRLGRPVLICPVMGIARKREWIMYHAREQGHRHIGVLDDDIRYIRRIKRPEEWAIGSGRWSQDVTTADLAYLCDWIPRALERASYVGLCEAGIYPRKATIDVAGRLDANHFFAVDRIPIEAIDWTRLEFNADADVILQLMERGHPTVIHRRYGMDSGQSVKPGGCTDGGRNRDTNNASVTRLAQYYAPFVTIRGYASRRAQSDWLVATIQWKAYWRYIKKLYGYHDPVIIE